MSDSSISLSRYRREVLERLASGPKTIDEAMQGRPNIMPMLIRAGWAESISSPETSGNATFVITEAGLRALSDGGWR